MNLDTPALAVIEGSLCRLNRRGTRAGVHAPLATAIVEFRRGPVRSFVREHPFGLLPGIPNLYCLDGDFRLLWLAEWPDPADPCAAIVAEDADTLTVTTVGGSTVHLEAETGRLRRVIPPLAVAG